MLYGQPRSALGYLGLAALATLRSDRPDVFVGSGVVAIAGTR